MPLNLPDLTALRERIANDIERTTGGDAHNSGTGFTEFANVVAGAFMGIYSNQEWLSKQFFTSSADDDNLLKQAAEFGIFQIAAAFATGTATIAGNNGAVITVGTVLQHTDGRQYRTTDEAVIVGGNATLNIIALDAGLAGNIENENLNFISPILSVDGEATAASTSGGAEVEAFARVRERLDNRKKQPPLGGAKHDYIQWAKAGHVDVTRAFPFENENGIGSLVLRIVTEGLENPIPTAAHINTVQNYIETVRPAGMRAFVVEAPVAVPINITFNAISPNTDEVQAAVEAELRDYLRRESKPDSTLYLSQIREAISNATGEQDFTINLTSNINLAVNQFAVLGSVTWPGQ